jgi:hypothetical protein
MDPYELEWRWGSTSGGRRRRHVRSLALKYSHPSATTIAMAPNQAMPIRKSPPDTREGRAGIALAASSSLVSSRAYGMGDTGARQSTSGLGAGTSSPTKMEPFQ